MMTVTKNLVKVALNTVQTKSAAHHYETNILSHLYWKWHGNTGHACEIWLDTKAAKFLTSLPPHFYVSADKSTVHRVTNQAIVVCPIIAGKWEAIPVQAPCVYDLEDIDNGITEATGDKLATTCMIQSVQHIASEMIHLHNHGKVMWWAIPSIHVWGKVEWVVEK